MFILKSKHRKLQKLHERVLDNLNDEIDLRKKLTQLLSDIINNPNVSKTSKKEIERMLND